MAATQQETGFGLELDELWAEIQRHPHMVGSLTRQERKKKGMIYLKGLTIEDRKKRQQRQQQHNSRQLRRNPTTATPNNVVNPHTL